MLRLSAAVGAMQRHEGPLYWMDSDWLAAGTALMSLSLYALVQQRFRQGWLLPVCGSVGAAMGFAVQWAFQAAGVMPRLLGWIVHYHGDLDRFPPEQLVMNWPNVAQLFPEHVGWVVGLIVGLVVFFIVWVRFRDGCALLTTMALGWFVGFLLFPVLLDWRMTPPRGDNWAGILGVFVGLMIYLFRCGLAPVAITSLVSGTVGGLGFAGMTLLKLYMVSFGNPALESDPAIVAEWKHWQSANWHSFLEQTYGFMNGIAILLGMAAIVRRTPAVDESGPRTYWTEAFAITFVVPVLVYVNLVKNLNEWTRTRGTFTPLPKQMRAPLFESVQLSASQWFHGLYLISAGAFVMILLWHRRRPVAMLQMSPIGRGQLLYLVVMWVFVLGNFARAVVGFHENRLLTEGTITVVAVMATLLVLMAPRDADLIPDRVPRNALLSVFGAIVAALMAMAASPFVFHAGARALCGDAHAGHAGQDFRFGSKANWRTKPLLKGELHR